MEKKTNGFLRESDLYAPVKAYLQALGWEVKAEVEDCDAAAVKDGKLLAAELKLTLNLDVVLQAVGRQRFSDVVYIAVQKKPKALRTQRWRDTLELLKRLNIGLLAVSNPGGRPEVEEFVEPVIADGTSQLRGRASRRRLRAMDEFSRRTGDRNTGGVRGRKIITAYREAALRLASRLAESGPASAKALKPEGEKSARTYAILKNNHYGWFNPLGGGLFGITEQGRAALDIYRGILQDDTPQDDAAFSGTVAD
jgi:hypothetical protein